MGGINSKRINNEYCQTQHRLPKRVRKQKIKKEEKNACKIPKRAIIKNPRRIDCPPQCPFFGCAALKTLSIYEISCTFAKQMPREDEKKKYTESQLKQRRRRAHLLSSPKIAFFSRSFACYLLVTRTFELCCFLLRHFFKEKKRP